MHKAPISMTYSRMIQQINNYTEERILKAVAECGIHVDRDELLKALAYDRNQYEKGFEDGKADALRWISVKDRLPKDGETVLVFDQIEKITAFTFAKDSVYGKCWYDDYEQGINLDWVSHWMPLPEAPKEDA